MRTQRTSPLRTVAAALLSAFLLILLAGAVYQFLSSRRDQRLHPAPGRLVDIGGYRLHINCFGSGSPTVVFDSGLSDDSLAWYKVQPAIAKRVRPGGPFITQFHRAVSGGRGCLAFEGFAESPRSAQS